MYKIDVISQSHYEMIKTIVTIIFHFISKVYIASNIGQDYKKKSINPRMPVYLNRKCKLDILQASCSL